MTNNLMTVGAQPLTMSSREIAEVVGSCHNKVKQSIGCLVKRGVIVQPPTADERETAATSAGGVAPTPLAYQAHRRNLLIAS